MSDMEEGELSDQEVAGSAPPTAVADHPLTRPFSFRDDANGGHRMGGGGSIFGRMGIKSARDLPDLVQSVDSGGLNVLDRDVTEKMSARAKRFNLQTPGSQVKFDEVVRLYESLGIPSDERDGSKEKFQRRFRLEALHVVVASGSASASNSAHISADDLMAYFGEFTPVKTEWLSTGASAHVIWALPASSAKAVLSLSRPLVDREEEAMEVNERVAGEDDDDGGGGADGAGDAAGGGSAGVNEKKKLITREEILARFDQASDTAIYTDELDIDVPPGRWRYGKPCDKTNVEHLLMRIASKEDYAIGGVGGREDAIPDAELRQKNIRLKQVGGLMSASRKRKLHDKLHYDRVVFEENQRQKKYNGPVGKNPWGTIAQEWSAPKPRDYADELAMFAKQRGIDARPTIKRKISAGPKDWDAPDEPEPYEEDDLDPISASLHRGQVQIGETTMVGVGEDADDADADEDALWNKKLKRPRMAMRADEVETKQSAKTRLYKGLKRRVNNVSRVEIFEEEEGEEAEEEEQLVEAAREPEKDLRLMISARMDDDQDASPSKRLNERFHIGGGRISSALVDRMQDHRGGGAPRRRHVSGDSLEMDNGEDLRGELDGRHAANMLIQVQQSDAEEEEEGEDDAAMETARPEENGTATQAAQAAASAPLAANKKKARPSSFVQKAIKQEAEEEERKARAKAIAAKQEGDRKKREEELQQKKERNNKESRDQELRRRRDLADERRRQQEEPVREERHIRRLRDERDRQPEGPARRRDGPAARDGPAKGGQVARKKKTAMTMTKKKRLPGGVKIKKEKLTDDERSSSSSSSDSSDSDSSSDDSSSSDSSDSDSSDSSSSSSSSGSDSSSDSERDRRKRRKRVAPSSKSKPVKRLSGGSARGGGVRGRLGRRDTDSSKRKEKPVASSSSSSKGKKAASTASGSSAKNTGSDRKKDGDKGKSSSAGGSSSKKDEGGLRDKLKEYLKKAKERKKKGGK